MSDNISSCCTRLDLAFANLITRLWVALRLFMAGVDKFRAGDGAEAVLARGVEPAPAVDEVVANCRLDSQFIFIDCTFGGDSGIAAIEAFKTSSANLVEPGLTGLVNVRSRRPLDFSGLEVAGSIWGNYPNQSEDFKPSAQLLVSNRWEVGDGDIVAGGTERVGGRPGSATPSGGCGRGPRRPCASSPTSR